MRGPVTQNPSRTDKMLKQMPVRLPRWIVESFLAPLPAVLEPLVRIRKLARKVLTLLTRVASIGLDLSLATIPLRAPTLVAVVALSTSISSATGILTLALGSATSPSLSTTSHLREAPIEGALQTLEQVRVCSDHVGKVWLYVDSHINWPGAC